MALSSLAHTPTPRQGNSFAGVYVILAILVTIGFLVIRGCGSSIPSNKVTQPIETRVSSTAIVSGQRSGLEESLEYKLASINKGYSVSKEDVTIARFRYLLDAIDAKTPESRQQVADMLVTAQQLLHDKHGKDIELLELAEGANTAIPDRANISFAEALAALIQMIR
jgi:hypothetical protein